MKFVKKHLFLIIYLFFIPTLHAQKQVVLIVPRSGANEESLFKEVKEGLDSDKDIQIEELASLSTWKDILDNLEKQDAASLEDRKGYFQKIGKNYYIEVKQEISNKQKETYRNTVNLYADSNKFIIDWISKKDDQYARKLLLFNLEKIKYCIKKDINKKDILLIRTTSKIRVDSLQDKYDHFGNNFLKSLALDAEINSKYSIIPIENTISREPPKAEYILGDITLAVTIYNDINGLVRVEIVMSDINSTNHEVNFVTKVSNRLPIEKFCSIVANDYLKEYKPQLLKDN